MQLEYAGAFNPLFLVRNNEIITYEADRMPIGIYDFSSPEEKFTNHLIDIQKGDTIYTFSDGYIDQFGGPKDKKFMLGRLKKIILEIQDIPMIEQRQKLDNALIEWMTNYEQIDDILVMGTKIS